MKKYNIITVVIEKTSTGFSAYAKEIEGIVTVGDNISELKRNFNEVFFEHLEYIDEIEGTKTNFSDFEINYVVDLEQFFEYFSVINKSAFAQDYIEMNSSLFRQYTKGLAPLSSDKLNKISKGLKKLAEEITDLNFTIFNHQDSIQKTN